MIKVGITGGESAIAGELLRLLVNHPDVEIISIHSPKNAGKPVAGVHHGFIGEPRLLFTSHFDATALDVAFILKPLHTSAEWSKLMADNPDLKLILYSESVDISEGMDHQPLLGLSEINRKGLVRGARTTVLPHPASTLSLIALYPLAHHLMLPNDLCLKISLPDDLNQDRVQSESHEEIKSNVSMAQSSYTGSLPIDYASSGRSRGMSVEFQIPCRTPLDEVFKIYDSIYDDHNFTFMVPFDVGYNEVEGTNKCIISLTKPDETTLSVRAIADARMRGGAGEAVHLMNLMSGLFEKTGLSLKIIDY
ncbi:MAG: hypothetical protein K2H86_00410 [Muribaculaceae bacterium]|nr:hypothetical protein [Muribaculaceae bacterium]